MERTTWALTGAGGFLGTALLRLLGGRGRPLRALIGPPGVPAAPLPAGVEPLYAEITDGAALASLARDAEVLIHLAGSPSVADSFARPVEHARVHVLGTAAVLEACRRAGVRRLVYASSAEVYGQPESNPVDEGFPLRPRSPYGAAKAAAEQFLRAHVLAGAGEAVALRLFSIYGPGQSPAGLLGAIIAQALKGRDVRLADPRGVRDYCYVDDVAEALARAAEVPLSGSYGVYNIGSGRGTSAGELAGTILRLLGSDREVLEGGARGRPAPAEIHELVADPARAARDLDWRARTALGEGLRRTLQRSGGGEAG